MAENSEWRLPVLSDEQKNWVVDARASGMSFEELTVHFREVYPSYATDIPKDVFPRLFTHRLKKILNSSNSSAKYYLEAKEQGEIPIDIEAVPLVVPHIRLLCFQRLWDETPTRTLQRVIQTKDGEVLIYKENTRERLAILTEFRKELELLDLLKTKGKSDPLGGDGEDVKVVREGGSLWEKKDASTDPEQAK